MKNILILITTLSLISCASSRMPSFESFDDLEYQYPVHHVDLSHDTQVAYIEKGTGPKTLLFIHGLGSYLPAWNKNIDELSAHYHCIAIDLPGYGKSSKGNYEFSMTYYAQVIKEFAAKKELENLVLVGHSMGGQIAMTAALQYPDMVEQLILVAPAGFETFNKGQRHWFTNAMTPDAVRLTPVDQIRTNLNYNFYNTPKDAEFMITDRIAMRSAKGFAAYCYAVSKSVKGMVDQPVYDFLPQIKHPTLALFGANDNLIPNRFLNGGKTETYAREGIERMPNGKLVMLEKTGHFAQFEKPEAVNQEILNFLK